MTKHLERELSGIRHGDHICLPYQDLSERHDVIIPFIAEGLARGERCVYTLAVSEQPGLLADLAAAGVNASRAVERGALWLRTPDEIYLRSGKFDPDDSLAYIEELIQGALADGFTGLRGSGEMSAGQESAIPWETVLSYEARVNEWFSKRPFVGLCRYRRGAFAPSVIRDVLRTHPVAIVSDKLCRNPYFEKSDVALAPDGDAARVDWMLRQLRWSRLTEQRLREMTRSLADQAARLAADNQTRQQTDQQLERAIRMRDRLLAILARELAMPVAALAEELRGRGAGRQGQGQGDVGEEAVGRHLRRLGALVEELHNVSRLTNRQVPLDLDALDLVDVARQVLLRWRDQLAAAGCRLDFSAEPRIQGTWDRRRLEQLLANLIGNAVRQGARRPIAVTLSSDADSARVGIRFCGSPLAPDEGEGRLFEEPDTEPGGRRGTGGPGLWGARDVAGALGGTLHVSEAPVGQDLIRGLTPGATLGETARDGLHGARPGAVVVETTLALELPRSPARPDRHRSPA